MRILRNPLAGPVLLVSFLVAFSSFAFAQDEKGRQKENSGVYLQRLLSGVQETGVFFQGKMPSRPRSLTPAAGDLSRLTAKWDEWAEQGNVFPIGLEFDMRRSYYAGDPFAVKLDAVVSGKNPKADLYVGVLVGGQWWLFFTGEASNPLSWGLVPAIRGFSVENGSHIVFQMKLPPAIDSLQLNLFAVLVREGTSIAFENLLSNLATASVSLVEEALDEQDRKQRNALITLGNTLQKERLDGRLSQGVIRHLDLGLTTRKSSLPAGSDLDDVAMATLAVSKDLLRIDFPRRELRLIGRRGGDKQRYHFRQYYQDIPVFGSWYKMAFRETEDTYVLETISGRYSPRINLKTAEPLLTGLDAVRVALGEEDTDLSKFETLIPPKLWIYDDALLAPECPKCPSVEHNPRLAWRLIFLNPRALGAVTDLFVDAENGKVLFEQPRSDLELQLNLFTAEGNASRVCFAGQASRREQWFDEEGECDYFYSCGYESYCPLEAFGCVDPDADGRLADTLSRALYDYYRSVFGRRSYDGDDSYIWTYVNASFVDEHYDPLGDNAMSADCGAFRTHQFSSGMMTSDIYGHEFGHSVHDSETDFAYRQESGAVAEHVGDMSGYFFACWYGDDCDWQVGEHSVWADSSGCGRDISDPSRCSQPELYGDYDPLPLSDDHGGVHTNSGILNKAGYLFTEGDTFSGDVITGIGEEKARQVYMEAIKNELGSTTGFEDFARDLYSACETLNGEGVTTPNDCCQINNAFAAVDIGTRDLDCDGIVDWEDEDNDGDLIGNFDDNCPGTPNPSQANADGDGMGDACDSDADNDWILNDDDNCPLVANEDQADFNFDGEGDACDDSDSDGIVDLLDNCPSRHNRGQEDSDGDGMGDSCDDDNDNDRVPNDEDNCEFVWNFSQDDEDGDGAGDLCDNCLGLVNLEQDDLDLDGEGDLCDDDIDGDGVSNARDVCPEEYTDVPEIMVCPPDTI